MDYKAAGVDIAAADDAKMRIRRLVEKSRPASVLTSIGSFGGMFRPDFSKLREPVLVASTDGVGTKIRVARDCGIHDTVGYDLVAHCVNDILVQGARPLFFLDYVAMGRLDPSRVEAIVRGIQRACTEFQCPLIGGETAEMPGTYAEDDYDLAGFIVGAVDRERALPSAGVAAGDLLMGLPSLGLHTNGYSLARRALFDGRGLDVRSQPKELLGASVGEALLAPHRSYLDILIEPVERGEIKALIHITGGGFPGNIPRVLPEGVGAEIDTSQWPVPPLFRLIESAGPIRRDEMFRTFNMGIGMIAVVDAARRAVVEQHFEERREVFHRIGRLVPGSGVEIH
jgi:phosphoribosylformylglycinamidine cyclo-ligase